MNADLARTEMRIARLSGDNFAMDWMLPMGGTEAAELVITTFAGNGAGGHI